jgi:hypothetical protein
VVIFVWNDSLKLILLIQRNNKNFALGGEING